MDYNYFCTNTNPYPKDSNTEIGNYLIFTFKPEYGSLQIGDTIQLKVDLKLANGKLFTDYNLLPEMNVTFTTISPKNVNGPTNAVDIAVITATTIKSFFITLS